jgi:hypothetical protein
MSWTIQNLFVNKIMHTETLMVSTCKLLFTRSEIFRHFLLLKESATIVCCLETVHIYTQKHISGNIVRGGQHCGKILQNPLAGNF